MVKCTTDNRNRTAGDVRSYFSKFGGNLGETGCVNWMFKERGEIVLPKDAKFDEDSFLLEALEAGADDVKWKGESLEIYTKPEDLETVKKSLEEKGIIMKGQSVKILAGEIKKKLNVKLPVSASAKAAIEKAGGTVIAISEVVSSK
jgi:transcriptional/translational regulatory protein YebC/TACO1